LVCKSLLQNSLLFQAIYQPEQKAPFVPVGVINPDKRPLHVIVQKEVILY